MSVTLRWLGHASFRIGDGPVVYVDPWKLERDEVADLVVVSHPHYDHKSVPDIQRLQGPETAVLTTPDGVADIPGRVETIQPGGRFEHAGAVVEAIPAYNPAKKFHPRANNWIGCVIHVGGVRIYSAGDTDATDEMAALRDIDVALMPVGGTYTMDAAEAATAVGRFGPRIAIPYHWGDIVGGRADADRFAALASCEVRILDRGEETERG